MTVSLLSKRFVSRGTRHRNECYRPVLDPSGAFAFLRIREKRESLVLLPTAEAGEVLLTEDTYVLDPHFAGGLLLWTERIGGDWRIRAAPPDGQGEVLEPFRHWGRPMAVSACPAGKRTILVWEERVGRQTRIFISAVEGGRFKAPTPVTDGTFNAYDPACAVAADGTVYIACAAFVAGNYRILMQKLTPGLRPKGEPFRISNRPGSCFYPSLCPRGGGGVWFSFTYFESIGGPVEFAFLQHDRAQTQHAFFRTRGFVTAGIFDGKRLWAPRAPAQAGTYSSGMAAMLAFGSKGTEHSRILEDAAGRVRLLLRQHTDGGEITFQQQDAPLRRSAGPRVEAAALTYPDVSIMTLMDDHWSPPVRIIPRAHLDAAISCAIDGEKLTIAFTEDARITGWNYSMEWFDAESELGVGVAELGLTDLGPPDYELHPYALTPAPGPSMENPPFRTGRSADGKHKLAIGQTHAHTCLSVCGREIDKSLHLNYRFMQDVQHCDFGATTDHGENLWHTEMLIMRKLAEYYNFPGLFVAIPAYEWAGSNPNTSGHEGGPFGHVNPLWLAEEGDLEVYSPCDPTCAGGSLRRLWQVHADQPVLTPPHHVADGAHPYQWDFFDPKFCCVVEIFQDFRGSGEQPRAPGVTNYIHSEQDHWVLDALKRGYRFGFIGGADHFGFALAGVFVQELTRGGLYEALLARRCFATTGTPLKVELTCNGERMGRDVACRDADFQLRVSAAEAIREIQVVRDGKDVEIVPVGGKRARHSWRARRKRSGEFWYCRVIFDNGEVAWSSPIWLV